MLPLRVEGGWEVVHDGHEKKLPSRVDDTQEGVDVHTSAMGQHYRYTVVVELVLVQARLATCLPLVAKVGGEEAMKAATSVPLRPPSPAVLMTGRGEERLMSVDRDEGNLQESHTTN